MMMNIFNGLLKETRIPCFYKARYDVNKEEIMDVREALKRELYNSNVLRRIESGESVALTAGSREINHLDEILLTLADLLKAKGAEPFIVPAMGSHGGATAEGQAAVLEGLGITEKRIGIPIRASMETVRIGSTKTGVPVHVDKIALSADHIMPVGRIKPHTDFKGQFESGLMKMLAIGLGKQQGASICHKLGMNDMSKNVQSIGREIIEKCSIPFGIGIIENAFHGIWKIAAVPGEDIERVEPKILEQAKALVPVVPFEKVDIIVIEEMGKDISGTGIDSNVIGRSASLGISRPFAERIGVFSLTEKSHGNANGMGLADSITKRFFDKIILEQTYPNAITSAETTAVKIPAIMPNDELCVKFLIQTCTGSGSDGLRIVWIRNTLSMDEFYISEGLKKEAEKTPDLHTIGKRQTVEFDNSGKYAGFRDIVQQHN